MEVYITNKPSPSFVLLGKDEISSLAVLQQMVIKLKTLHLEGNK